MLREAAADQMEAGRAVVLMAEPELVAAVRQLVAVRLAALRGLAMG